MNGYMNVFKGLSEVMNFLAPRPSYPIVETADAHADRMRTRRILHKNANDGTALYVVTTGTARTCVVSEYAVAMFLADKMYGVSVYAVRRETDGTWYVVKQ